MDATLVDVFAWKSMPISISSPRFTRSVSTCFTAFEIEACWKEQLFYWEGSNGVEFQASWGVSPGVIDLDSKARWQQEMGHREEHLQQFEGLPEEIWEAHRRVAAALDEE